MRPALPLVCLSLLLAACAASGGASPNQGRGPGSKPAAVQTRAVPERCSVYSKRECNWAPRYHRFTPR